MEASAAKERRHLEIVAWQTAHLLNPWTKKRIKPSDLLGTSRRVDRGSSSRRDFMSRMRDRQKLIDSKRG